MKNFLGEKAFKHIENTAYDSEAIRAALVTPQNARAVFSDLTEFQTKSLISEICDSGAIGKVIHSTQEEIKSKFAEAGYGTVIFDDEQEIDKCQKYYAGGERICTYNNLRARMREYHMIVAIKDNIDNIERSQNPQREDEYGTSIINIQIAKNGSHMSIKNRYNHRVEQCDSTFNNNLNNVSKDLHGMVLGYYGFAELKNKQDFYYPNIIHIGKVYLKYRTEINNIYFGEFILDGVNGIRYADPGLYHITNENYHNRWNCPLVLDFRNKIAIDLVGGNKKSMLITRAMKEGLIHSGNKDQAERINMVFENATKELLETNKYALKYAHRILGYDFQKPYKVMGVLGNFTAKNIEKTIGITQALLLCLHGSDVMPVIMDDGFNALDGRIDRGDGMSTFYRQGDFERYRKSPWAACYVICQDKKYRGKVKPKLEWNIVSTPESALKERLLEYKAKKRKEEADAIDFTETVDKMKSEFIELKNRIVQAIILANDPDDYDKLPDLSGWFGMGRLLSHIEDFQMDAINKTFTSIKSAQCNINNIMERMEKIKRKLKR